MKILQYIRKLWSHGKSQEPTSLAPYVEHSFWFENFQRASIRLHDAKERGDK
jgi:hypothetical protein